MKKLIIITLLLIVGFGIWKYVTIKNQTASPADRQPSMIKETKDTLDQTANYLPDAIDRKNTMENKIKDSSAQENERIQKSMEELQ